MKTLKGNYTAAVNHPFAGNTWYLCHYYNAKFRIYIGLFTARDVHGLAEEVLKMQAFHHNHVMSLIGVCLDSGAGPAVVMPYMANGSLLDYLRKERASLLLHDDATATKV